MSTKLKFVRGKGNYKYTAILPSGKRVSFGDRRYGHFKDRVPKSQGGGLWSRLDHGDAARRANYQQRHGGIITKNGRRAVTVKYSPAWFSYHYLW